MAQKEHTELEKKLFEQIIFLMNVVNIYSRALQYFYDHMGTIFQWVAENSIPLNTKKTQDDLVEFLNEEFEWNFETNGVKGDENVTL